MALNVVIRKKILNALNISKVDQMGSSRFTKWTFVR